MIYCFKFTLIVTLIMTNNKKNGKTATSEPGVMLSCMNVENAVTCC